MNFLKTSIATLVLMLGTVTPAFALGVTAESKVNATADTGIVKASVSAQTEARITKGKERADQEIDRRINALNVLNSRVQAMIKISADAKATVNSGIQSQIAALTTLKAKIAADTDLDTLKADVQSITKSYRIFLLVIPQGHIMVAADKLKAVAREGVDLAANISARIDAASALGKDVENLRTSVADMRAKLAEADVQADAAVKAVATLKPDGGDQAVATTNTQALKEGRASIKAGMQSIDAARKEAHTIIKALADFNLDVSASSSATVQ